jgi:cadmium resistance protein CadD (predicted permease)
LETIFTHIFIAITTFALTNLDDLVLLTIYFAHSEIYKTRDVVTGQYAGIFFLVVISLSGIILGEIIDKEWIRFLGIIPLYLGLKGIYSLIKNKNNKENVSLPNTNSTTMIKVALVTIANGGDNIGVYTPLFAVTPVYYVYLYLILFFIFIGIWCLLGKFLVSHDKVKNIFTRYGRTILPVFLILLGCLIIF